MILDRLIDAEHRSLLAVLGLRSVVRLPGDFSSKALETVLGMVFGPSISAGDLDFLGGHRVAVQVNDLEHQWLFSFDGKVLRVSSGGGSADVTISGGVSDFVLLASAREDPDTLFFQRRLVVEGDTELGLRVKYFLDHLDPGLLPPWTRWTLDRVVDFFGARN